MSEKDTVATEGEQRHVIIMIAYNFAMSLGMAVAAGFSLADRSDPHNIVWGVVFAWFALVFMGMGFAWVKS